jgi:hypothetical protein
VRKEISNGHQDRKDNNTCGNSSYGNQKSEYLKEGAFHKEVFVIKLAKNHEPAPV